MRTMQERRNRYFAGWNVGVEAIRVNQDDEDDPDYFGGRDDGARALRDAEAERPGDAGYVEGWRRGAGFNGPDERRMEWDDAYRQGVHAGRAAREYATDVANRKYRS